jgi:GntR family transcriptional regulator, rspAB operon transcriptional repressor
MFALQNLETETIQPRLQTIGVRVFESLKEAIVQLRLQPGNPLSEAEVARQLGVSRQPVREAFIKLSETGFVEIRPQRGTFVKMISLRDVENLRFIRETIEVAVVRKAALEADAEGIGNLKAIVARQRTAARSGDHAGFLRLDEAFHQAIAQSVDCEHAWRVLENLKAQLDRVRYLSMPNATPMSTLISQHNAIIEALVTRDPDKAEAAMRAHLGEILSSLPRIAEGHPELFTA